MSQGEDGLARRTSASGAGSGDTMTLIRERQGAAGNTHNLDLSYANLDTFPTEVEYLRDVLEK